MQRYVKFPKNTKTKATATYGQPPSRTYIIMDCSTL